jgi:hypothetical protein
MIQLFRVLATDRYTYAVADSLTDRRYSRVRVIVLFFGFVFLVFRFVRRGVDRGRERVSVRKTEREKG